MRALHLSIQVNQCPLWSLSQLYISNRDMITILATRIQRTLPFRSIFAFSKHDGRDKLPKAKDSPFFAKQKHREEKPRDSQITNTSRFKDNQVRSKPFTKRDKQATRHHVKEESNRTIRSKQDEEPTLFMKEDKGQAISLVKESKDKMQPVQKRTITNTGRDILQQEGQTNEFELNISWCDKLEEDGDKLLQLFDGQKWKQLSQFLATYNELVAPEELVKYIHPLFVARSTSKYLNWITSTKLSVNSLPPRLIKTLLLDLVHEGSWLAVKNLIPQIDKQSLNLEYSVLDAIFCNIDEKASLQTLKSQIPIQIQMALALLEMIDIAKYDSDETYRANEYLIDSWFVKLWQIVKQRRLCRDSFVDLFETLVCDHYKGISLMSIHSKGVFLDILETYYFGSHATTKKIKQLFEHTYLLPCYDILLTQLRDRMRAYKAKNGTVPFPNAKKIFNEMQQQISKQDYERAIFFYLLCLYGNEAHPFTIFQNKKQLLDLMIMDDRFEDIVYDGLFNLPKDTLLQPRPKGAQQIEQEERIIKKGAEQELKQFFNKQPFSNKLSDQNPSQKFAQLGYDARDVKDNDAQVQESESMEEEELYLADFVLSTFRNPLDGLDGVSQLQKNRKKPKHPINKEEVEEMFAEAQNKSEEDISRPVDEQSAQVDLEGKKHYHLDDPEDITQALKWFNMQPLEEIKELYKVSQQLFIDKIGKEQISGPAKIIKNEFEKQIKQLKEENDECSDKTGLEKISKYKSSSEHKDFQFQLLEFQHRAELNVQITNETNYFRKMLLKNLMHPETTDSVKAAIKLDRPELAFTIFKQKIMKPFIEERITKNIKYVAQAFLREHYQHNKDLDIHQIIDSINMDNILALNEQQDNDRYRRFQQAKFYKRLAYVGKPKRTNFLGSIYQKLQNFDYLIWKQIPPGSFKHNYWESTLLLDRTQELAKMDISGKLSQMAYEPQYETLPSSSLKRIRQGLDWRNELIHRLGLQEGEPVPSDSVLELDNYWVSFQSNEQAYKYLVQPQLNNEAQIDVNESFMAYGPHIGNDQDFDLNMIKQIEMNGLQTIFKGRPVPLANAISTSPLQHQNQAQEESLQYLEDQENQPQEQEEEVEEVLEEGNSAQPAQQLEAQQEQPDAEQEHLQAEQEQLEAEQEQPEAKMEPQQQASESQTARHEQYTENIYRHSQRTNTLGYDFNVMVDQTRNIFRPMFQKMYEQQKAFIKHMLALEAIAEQARISDNHSLQKKLNESEEQLTDAGKIAQLLSYGLWNYDFVSVEKPEQYIQRADLFRQKFFEFKKYMGAKGPGAVPDLSKQHVANFYLLINERRVTRDLVEELLMKRYDLFLEAEAVVKLEPSQEVQEMLLWGVLNDEPLAVYLGEKLAMLTNQKIPHNLALLVSRYLSHRREVPEDRIRRCKAALRIVGRINREHIYDMSKDYEHITVRKHLDKYINERQKQLQEQSLGYLTKLDARHFNQEGRLSKQKLSRAGLTV